MTLLEIILLIGGVICIIVSFFIGNNSVKENLSELNKSELTDNDKEKLKQQIDAVIDEQIETIADKTEAQLDKISNTKILEMNDYAKTVIDEINRNHNETVFLYDMLNEKAKEVKSTVKDVNVAKKEIEMVSKNISSDSDKSSSKQENTDLNSETATDVNIHKTSIVNNATGSKDLAKERLIELIKKSNEKNRTEKNEVKELDNNAKPENIIGTQADGIRDIENKPKTKSTAKKKASSSKTKTSSSKTKTSSSKTTTSSNEGNTSNEQIKEVVFEEGATKNDKIITLHNSGFSNKEIAKELNLGIGEVKLVIDLFTSDK